MAQPNQPNQPFLTITRHAANLLFDTLVSTIWIIPQHTVASLRTRLDSSYDQSKIHEEVDVVVRELRGYLFKRRIIMGLMVFMTMTIMALVCMGAGALLWEHTRRRLEEGVYLNFYAPRMPATPQWLQLLLSRLSPRNATLAQS